ncbi:MAG: DoxX family protein [Acidobacteria bacterium]|nr:DoxX family protein [Acidobacteriota bacterium]
MALETTIRDRSAVDWALLAARVIVGIVFVAHGAQILFGAFGGPGLSAFVRMLGPIGYLVAVGEFFGGLGLVFGFLSRFSAASLILIMLGAVATVHCKIGFFMNWTGKQAGEGFEYHLLAIGILLPVLIAGPGRFAVGRLLPLPRVASKQRPLAVFE